jgi:hypothetical protein
VTRSSNCFVSRSRGSRRTAGATSERGSRFPRESPGIGAVAGSSTPAGVKNVGRRSPPRSPLSWSTVAGSRSGRPRRSSAWCRERSRSRQS